jgi:hypothetical protein
MRIIDPHLGQLAICPIMFGLRTRMRLSQLVHWIVKLSTVDSRRFLLDEPSKLQCTLKTAVQPNSAGETN